MKRSMPTGRFEIRDWVVDPQIDEIVSRGSATKLEPRMTRLLVCLAESAGQVVSSQRLLDEVWADVVVSPASIYQSISQLRKILGDTDSPPTYIATVPRKGYRLVAPVRWLDERRTNVPDAQSAHTNTTATAPTAPQPGTGPRRSPRLTLAIAATAVAILAAVALLFLLTRNNTPPPSALAGPSLAVLPFVDLTTEQRDQPFCDGLSEELSSWLAQIPGMRVVARTSAFSFRGRGEDARAIGRSLAATHILEGSVRRSGNEVRVTAELIDTRDGYRVWTVSVDRPFTDVIHIQEDIARSVAAALEIRLSNEAANRLKARQPSNARAYELYLLARHYQSKRTAESNARAIELYEQSIATDANFAPAYASLAYATLNQAYFNNRRMAEAAPQAEPLLAKALKLDATLSDGYAVRGALRAEQSRLDDAVADLTRAISLNSNDARAFLELGRAYRRLGQPQDALTSFTQATTLDPLDFIAHIERCVELQGVGRFDEAAVSCSRARALEGKGVWGATATAWLTLAQGKLDEALAWTDRALQVAPENLDLYESRVDYLLALGLPQEARATYERARRVSSEKDRLEADIANVVFFDQGAPALIEYLAHARFEESTHADVLMAAVRLRMLIGDTDTARQLLDRARSAPDFDTNPVFDTWEVRWGTAREMIIALVEARTGADSESQARRRRLAALMDKLERNGQSGYGLHVVRAQVLALDGDADGAMRSLQRAADLGWRAHYLAQHEPQFAVLWPRADFRALMERLSRANELMRANVPTG